MRPGGAVRRRLRKEALVRRKRALPLLRLLHQRIDYLEHLENEAWRAANPELAIVQDAFTAASYTNYARQMDHLMLYGTL